MVRMISAHTGTVMWVHESRVDEYLARGHALAVPPAKPAPEEPVKRPAKRGGKAAQGE